MSPSQLRLIHQEHWLIVPPKRKVGLVPWTFSSRLIHHSGSMLNGVCVCVCLCAFMCDVWCVHVCVCVCACAYKHACAHAHMYLCVCVCAYLHAYLCASIHEPASVWVHLCTCLCVHAGMHVHLFSKCQQTPPWLKIYVLEWQSQYMQYK